MMGLSATSVSPVSSTTSRRAAAASVSPGSSPPARRRPDGVSTTGFDIAKEEDTVGGVEQNDAGGNA